MGFKDVRSKAIESLEAGKTQSEERPDIVEKNLFKTGVVTAADVVALLKHTRGDQYRVVPHNIVSGIEVHIFEPVKEGVEWHIKFYFLDPNCVFISVHKSHVTKGGTQWNFTKKATIQKRFVRRAKK